MTRVFATSLRMAWAAHPYNIYVTTAAMVFLNAGVILLFVANLLFAQRIVRAQHPHFGWSRPFSLMLPILLFVVIGTTISLVGGIIMEFYSRTPTIALAVRDIKLCGSTIHAIVAFAPIPIVSTSAFTRRHLNAKTKESVDRLGEGPMTAKVAIVIFSAVLLTLGATFRSATTWLPPIPVIAGGFAVKEPWYYSRGSFYFFNFGIELCIACFWLIVRIDKHFIIPNGAKGPYSYSRGLVSTGGAGNEKLQRSTYSSTRNLKSSQISETDSRRGSRISWASESGGCHSVASHMTWDAVWRGRALDDIGEDLDDVLSYYQDGEMSQIDSDFDFDFKNVGQETACEAQSGRWALRPISGLLSCYMR